MIKDFEDIYPKTKQEFTLRKFTFLYTKENINAADMATKIQAALDFIAPFCSRIIARSVDGKCILSSKFNPNHHWKPYIVDIRIPVEEWATAKAQGLPVCEVTMTDKIRIDESTSVNMYKQENIIDLLMYYAGISDIYKDTCPWQRTHDDIILDIHSASSEEKITSYAVDVWLAKFCLLSTLDAQNYHSTYGALYSANFNKIPPKKISYPFKYICLANPTQCNFMLQRIFRMVFGELSIPVYLRNYALDPTSIDYHANYFCGKLYSHLGIQDPKYVLDENYTYSVELCDTALECEAKADDTLYF